MDTGLGSRVADDADGFAGAFAGARIGLGALAPDRQAAEVADAAVTFDALEALEVHPDLAAQIAFDDVFAVLDGVDDLRKLLLGEILGADGGINIGLGQDDFGVGGAEAIDVAQGHINAFVGRNFYTNYTCHKSELAILAVVCDGGWCKSPG